MRQSILLLDLFVCVYEMLVQFFIKSTEIRVRGVQFYTVHILTITKKHFLWNEW